MFEVGYNFGLRVSELQSMKVRQIDVGSRTIRLEVGETKNDEGREIEMTPLVYAFVQQCVTGKQGNDSVFTRESGQPVRDFRDSWEKVCCTAGVGKMVCPSCGREVTKDGKGKAKCGHCSKDWKQKEPNYSGLIFHDLRRTAVRNMVRGGIPERVAMAISGHKTQSLFDRYNIVSQSDLHEAAKKLALRDQEREAAQAKQSDFRHSSGTFEPSGVLVASVGKLN